MARKPTARKRRQPAAPAARKAAPATSKRPATRPGAACLERLLTRDATHFNLVAQIVQWCGTARPLAALDATSRTCAQAARTSIRLALTAEAEAHPLVPLVTSHASRRNLSKAGAGRRLVLLEAPGGAHANIKIEAEGGPLYRPQSAPPGVVIVASGAPDALADCGVLVVDTSKLGSAARARRITRRLALQTTARQGPETLGVSTWSRLHLEFDALREVIAEMGRRTALDLDIDSDAARDLILAVGAAAADVADGRMTLPAVRRACAAAPRSASSSRGDRASRRHTDAEKWFELALQGKAPPFVALEDDTIGVAHPRLLAALVALKRSTELLAGPRGAYAAPRWAKQAFRLPQLYAFEAAMSYSTATDATQCGYLDALALAAKPLKAGDPVLLCEEHGGASTRACVIVRVAQRNDVQAELAVRLVAVGAARNSEAWRRAEAATPLIVARWRVRRAVRCGVAALCRAAASEGCAKFLDELGTNRNVDLITPVSAKKHDGIVHRAARAGRAECARVLARRGASRYTCCATGHQASVLAQASALLPSERAGTTKALDESAGDNWLRNFSVTIKEQRRHFQRDLLKACELYVPNEHITVLPRATHAARGMRQMRRAVARLALYRVLLQTPADADAVTQARYAKCRFAALCTAARAGRAAVVVALADEFACDPAGRNMPSTPLHAAVQAPGTACCQVLLDRVGTHASQPDARGACVLRAAGRANKPETLAFLCGHRLLQTAAQGANGATALQAAAFSGFADVARILLEAGADASYADDEGWTGLMLAAQNGHADVCELLVERGADRRARTRDGYTALMACSKDGHADVASLLLGDGVDARFVGDATSDGYTALLAACNYGHVEVARLLIEHGADVEGCLGDGWSALMAACCHGSRAVALLLLDKGANAKRKDGSGYTALLCAASQGRKDCAQLLLERGVDVSAKDRNGDTALGVASLCGHAAVVELLLDHGADAARADAEDGCTPLMNAAYGANAQVTQALVRRQPKCVEMRDDLGRTALMIAAEAGAARHASESRARAARVAHHLLRAGAATNRSALDGRTAVHLAAQHGNASVLRLLLAAEGAIEAKDCCGATPLAHAVTGGHCSCARILLAAGAATATLFPGETATHLKAALLTDAALAAYAATLWNRVEHKRSRRQVKLKRCPLERVRGRPTQSSVTDDHRCRFVGFNTLCADRARAPRHARVFYEVVIERCVGVVQLGWIGTISRGNTESGDGVGDDRVSWGVDGIRLKKWSGGDATYSTTRKWRDGDVVGCCADLTSGDLSFALNGHWGGPDVRAFRSVDVPEQGLAPAVTGGYGFACGVNLGDRPWRHQPPFGFRSAQEFFLESAERRRPRRSVVDEQPAEPAHGRGPW